MSQDQLNINKMHLYYLAGPFAVFFLSVVLCACISINGYAQINLVQNPSFENISSCPTQYNQINLAVGWDTLINGGGGKPETYNSCANPNTYVGVPVNSYGLSYQLAKTGVSYASMGLYVNPFFYSQREYIQNTLIRPLEIGKNYCVTFFVSLNNRCQYAIDELGAYFDNGIISTPTFGVFVANPQIKSPTGIFYSDTLNWMKVQGSFIASDAFAYLTLGNFRSNANTNKIEIANGRGELAEYYIDDVSVIDINMPANAGRDTSICETDSVFLGRQNEIGIECSWLQNNNFIGSGAGIWIKPKTTTAYVVKQKICDFISHDTVKVIVKDEDCYDIDADIPNTFTPNEDGINDSWHFNLKRATEIKYTIYNRWGNIMKESAVTSYVPVCWEGKTTEGEFCVAGVYYYILSYTNAKGIVQKKNGYISLFR